MNDPIALDGPQHRPKQLAKSLEGITSANKS